MQAALVVGTAPVELFHGDASRRPAARCPQTNTTHADRCAGSYPLHALYRACRASRRGQGESLGPCSLTSAANRFEAAPFWVAASPARGRGAPSHRKRPLWARARHTARLSPSVLWAVTAANRFAHIASNAALLPPRPPAAPRRGVLHVTSVLSHPCVAHSLTHRILLCATTQRTDT